MVKIRLRRIGKKGQPTYRLVVADARSPRNGRFVAALGTYNPRTEPSVVEVDADGALDWLRRGAQPTPAATKLLEIAGVMARFEAERRPSARRG